MNPECSDSDHVAANIRLKGEPDEEEDDEEDEGNGKEEDDDDGGYSEWTSSEFESVSASRFS